MKTAYNHSPISSVKSLVKALGVTEIQLKKTLSCVEKCYAANKPDIKPNGKIRQTYTVSPLLKHIQSRIVSNIFYSVNYPIYLQGSIRDREQPRNCVNNAALHSGAMTLISEDISNFFPSISSEHVYSMWKHLFCFTHEISEILTSLTTYKNFVPQGSPTSSYVANLIFWQGEENLEKKLAEKGYIYSRYVDDISISAKKILNNQEKSEAIKEALFLFKRYGVNVNREKHKISSKKSRMTVNNLNVNSNRATINKRERKNIRLAVYQCQREFNVDPSSEEYLSLYRQTMGRAQRVKSMHQSEGEKHILALKKIKPL